MASQETLIGKGTLQEFHEQYSKLNQHKNITVKASTLFPIGNAGEEYKSKTECTQIYEYVIYYDEYLKETTATKTVQAPCGAVEVPQPVQELIM